MTDTAAQTTATTVTPYLTAADAVGALDWYVGALGAVERFRVVGDDGRLGHAEFTIGTARFMLSDEYPEMGVTSPSTLGGTAVALHLAVGDVDAVHARAVDAGATELTVPEDQPHGARHSSILDPSGHRWMLSQELEEFDLDAYAARSAGSGFEVVAGDDPDADRDDGSGAHVWPVVCYHHARDGIRFLIDVFGFEEKAVITADDDADVIVHAELRWPEGGIVQPATWTADNPHLAGLTPGSQSLYVVTNDPQAVFERCRAAAVEVVAEPESPHYDPDGMNFTVRDPAGNTWCFGTYAG